MRHLSFSFSSFLRPFSLVYFFWLGLWFVGGFLGGASDAQADTEAEKVRVEASLDRASVLLKDRIRLTLKIAALASDRPSFRPPRLRGLLPRGQKTETSKEAVYLQGKPFFQQKWIHHFDYEARKIGSFTFPPIAITVRKQIYKTPDLSFDVTDRAAKATQGSEISLPAVIQPQGEIFLLPVLSHQKAYPGQQILVAFYLLRRPSCDIAYESLPRFEGFWTETLHRARSLGDWQRRMIQGQEYWGALVLRAALFALQPGPATIDPLVLRVQSVTSAASSAGQILRSKPLSLEILPLPEDGKPEDFSASQVGRFSLQTRLLTAQASVGQPLVIQASLRGSGNLRQIALPSPPTLQGFRLLSKRSEVSVKDTDGLLQGELQTTWIFLPEKSGSFAFPSLSWASFDPVIRKYQTHTTKELPLTVAEGASPSQGLSASSEREAQTPDASASSKAPFSPQAPGSSATSPSSKDSASSVSPASSLPFSSAWFGLLALLPLFLAGVMIVRRRSSKRTPAKDDPAPLLAGYQKAREDLQTLASSLSAKDAPSSDALVEIEASLLQLSAFLLRKPTRGLSLSQLESLLADDPRSAPLRGPLLRLLRLCQELRFSPFLPTETKEPYSFSRELLSLLSLLPVSPLP